MDEQMLRFKGYQTGFFCVTYIKGKKQNFNENVFIFEKNLQAEKFNHNLGVFANNTTTHLTSSTVSCLSYATWLGWFCGIRRRSRKTQLPLSLWTTFRLLCLAILQVSWIHELWNACRDNLKLLWRFQIKWWPWMCTGMARRHSTA